MESESTEDADVYDLLLTKSEIQADIDKINCKPAAYSLVSDILIGCF